MGEFLSIKLPMKPISDICGEKLIPLVAPSSFLSPSLQFLPLSSFHSVFLIPNSNCLFLPLLSLP